MAGFSVVGFDVGELVQHDDVGEIWAARGRATGRAVELRRIPASAAAERRQLLASAERLAAVQHPHLVRVRGVLETDDAVVLVVDPRPRRDLAGLHQLRGRLTAAEVVTVAAPLAEALAALHEHGLAHGRVGPSTVLIDDSGRPLLADAVGTLCGDGGREGPSAAADVHDLAATAAAALTGTLPRDAEGAAVSAPAAGPAARRLLDVLAAAMAADPDRRPPADRLAAAILAVTPAAPLRLGNAAKVRSPADDVRSVAPSTPRRSATSRGRGRRRRRPGGALGWRGAVGGMFGVVAVVMATLSGLAWAGADSATPPAAVQSTQTGGSGGPGDAVGRSGPPPASSRAATAASAPATTSAPRPRATAWAAVLARLDAKRAAAFASADRAALRRLYAADAPALRRDQRRLRELIRAGLRAQGLHLRARSVSLRSRSPTRPVLRVTDVLEPYELRSPDGTLVERRPGRGAVAWLVTLSREAGRWRIYDVVAS